MPNIPSPAGSVSSGVFAHAGLYTDTVTYPSGAAAASIPVTIYDTGTTTLAALFTDRTMAVPAANPVTSSALGNLSFYALPAEYDVWVAGVYAFTVLVGIDPQDSGEASGLQAQNNLIDVGSIAVARTNLNVASPGADLTGTTNTTVTSTHLTVPLPLVQGGTGASAQNFVDLTTGQTVAGVKAFTSNPTVPTPVNPTDVVNKAYADSNTSALAPKSPAKLGTIAVLSPANTYSGGVLTATGVGTLTVDGVLVALNDRVLVKNEAAPANNGLYSCTTAGTGGVAYVLTRTTDMNTGGAVPGAQALVTAGGTNQGAQFTVSGAGPFTLGTTAITWVQTGQGAAYSAGTGLTLTGSTFSVTPSTFDASGAATTAQGNSLQKSSNLSDLGSLTTAKTNLGVAAASGIASLDSSSRVLTTALPLSVPQLIQLSERSVSDGVITSTTTLTSATAAFVVGDTGRTVVGANIPAGTTLTYSSATVCTLSQACTNGTSQVITIVQGVYPLRATVTADATRYVMWRGAIAPTVGGGYLTAGVDDYLSTA